MATVDPQTIVDAIDTVLLNGFTDASLAELADRRILGLAITKSTTMGELIKVRDYYQRFLNVSGSTERTAQALIE